MQMSAPVSVHQPPRPRFNNGNLLQFTTRPKRIGERFPITSYKMRVAQMLLYRAVVQGQMMNNVKAAEFHEWLCFDYPDITKRHIGATINHAVLYDASPVAGKSKENPVAGVVYRFTDMLDLQYGLEWQLCSWLRKFLNDNSAPEEQPISGHEMMEAELEVLGFSDDRDFAEIYLKDQIKFVIDEPDWRAILAKHGPDRLPKPEEAPAIRPEPPKPLR